MGKQATPASRTMIPVEGHPGIWRRGNRYVVKYTDRGQVRKKYLRTLTEAKKFNATAAGRGRPPDVRAELQELRDRMGAHVHAGAARRGSATRPARATRTPSLAMRSRSSGPRSSAELTRRCSSATSSTSRTRS